MWQNFSYDKCQFMTTIPQIGLLVGTFWHFDNQWDVLWVAFWDSHNFLYPFFLFFLPTRPPRLGSLVITISIHIYMSPFHAIYFKASPCPSDIHDKFKASHWSNLYPLPTLLVQAYFIGFGAFICIGQESWFLPNVGFLFCY